MAMVMAGIDYSLADLDIRSAFSLTHTSQASLFAKLLQQADIDGAVILTTCNRTEIYLSCTDRTGQNDCESDPFEILCHHLALDFKRYQKLQVIRHGAEVFQHLCLLACGCKSQIWGEDQIITQVKESLAFARQCQATDRYLEVLFRTAITAAKKIKASIRFSNADRSVADKALHLIEQFNQPVRTVESILVIGNGLIGRLAAEKLQLHGFSVAMTRRQHHGPPVPLPEGMLGLDYDQRYTHLTEFDAVISATSSPHQTITLEVFSRVSQPPRLLIDLAVPRDIDKRIGDLPDIRLETIDTLAHSEIAEDHGRQLDEIDQIILQYECDWQRWMTNHLTIASSPRGISR